VRQPIKRSLSLPVSHWPHGISAVSTRTDASNFSAVEERGLEERQNCPVAPNNCVSRFGNMFQGRGWVSKCGATCTTVRMLSFCYCLQRLIVIRTVTTGMAVQIPTTVSTLRLPYTTTQPVREQTSILYVNAGLYPEQSYSSYNPTSSYCSHIRRVVPVFRFVDCLLYLS
jgi:hypothetical protein